MANTKQFNLKLSPEEDQRLTELANLTHLSRAAVLKQSLYTVPVFGETLIYEAMKRIHQHLEQSDTEAIREEMMQLCLSLNLLMKNAQNNTMTSRDC